MLCNRYIAKHFVLYAILSSIMLLIKYRFVKDAFQLPNHKWMNGTEMSSEDTLLEIDNFASSVYLATVIDAIKREDSYHLYLCEDTSEYNVEPFGAFVNKLYKLSKPRLVINTASNPLIEKWIAPLK